MSSCVCGKASYMQGPLLWIEFLMTWRQMSPRTPLFLLQATIGPPRRCALQDSRQYALKPRTTDAARSRPLRAPARNSGTTLPPSEALRSIRLPEDKKGRKALLEATTLWKEQREKVDEPRLSFTELSHSRSMTDQPHKKV